jgi:hypothetical protein
MKKQAQNLFNKLFPSYAIKNTTDQPAQNQPLIREDSFKKEFDLWKHSPAREGIFGQILESYLTRSTKEFTHQIALYAAPGAIGLTIKMPEQTDLKIYRFLLDYLRERVMMLQYRLYSSSIEEVADANELRYFYERHYLKPSILNENYPIDQLYGNIMLELEYESDEVRYLKVMSTYHTGYNYKPPLGFDALVQYLFGSKESNDGDELD